MIILLSTGTINALFGEICKYDLMVTRIWAEGVQWLIIGMYRIEEPRQLPSAPDVPPRCARILHQFYFQVRR